jgi:hypothetical protein
MAKPRKREAVPTAKPIDLTELIGDMLIVQVGSLLGAAAEALGQKDAVLATKLEVHFNKLIGANCTAKAAIIDKLAKK